MNGRPTAAQLLEAVAGFRAQAAAAAAPGAPDAPDAPGAPADQGAMAYHAKVASKVQEIVRREALLRPAADAAERGRLQRLLGCAEPDLAWLNRQLCLAIAAGRLGLHTPGLAEHLWRTTLDQLAVDQPSYSTYRRLSADAAGATPDVKE